jgi:hypothetical protein
MLKSIALLGSLILLAGCTASSTKVEDGDFDPNKLVYFQDSRTKLCFAVIGYERTSSNMSTSTGMSMSNVPCTNEVVALLRPMRQRKSNTPL